MKSLILAALACAATATTAFAEPWSVTDGSPAYLKNVWDIASDKGRLTASAGVVHQNGDTAPSRRVTFAGVVLNGEYRFSLPASDIGPDCLFVGKRESSGEIVGVATCGGRNSLWRARRM